MEYHRPATESEKCRAVPVSRARILVVDDDRNVCSALKRILSDSYKIRAAESGEAALAVIDEWVPDLVLADVLMPGIGGHGLLKAIRSHRAVSDIPVIMISGAVDEAVVGLDAGANDYITKPFRPEHLHARVRAALRLSNYTERYQRLLDGVPVGVFRMDLEGDLVEVNRTLVELLEYPDRADLIGKSVDVLIPDRHVIADLQDRIGSGSDRAGVECKVTRRDESMIWCRLQIQPVRSRRDVIAAYDATVEDISGRIASDEELERAHVDLSGVRDDLLRSQKMAAVGELASGVAHEINTPIQYIGDNIRFITEAFESMLETHTASVALAEAARGVLEDDVVDRYESAVADADVEFLFEEIPESSRQALEGVGKVAEIVRALKSFAHPGGDVKAPVDLAQTIRDVSTVARNEYKYVADLELVFDPDAGEFFGFSGKLSQALLNIVVNASHAITAAAGDDLTARGKITIETRAAGEFVEIRISDTGTGIPQDVVDHIFDPFFTTKEVGKGSGQGLAIARAVVVEHHCGEILVETEPGAGTTFILRLPRGCADDDS